MKQARTYPDLLKSPHDEELLEYYCQSNLIYIKVSFSFLPITLAEHLRRLRILRHVLVINVLPSQFYTCAFACRFLQGKEFAPVQLLAAADICKHQVAYQGGKNLLYRGALLT